MQTNPENEADRFLNRKFSRKTMGIGGKDTFLLILDFYCRCLQEINHLTSLPTKFPLMYTIASENIRNEGSSPSIPIDSQSSPETTSSPSLISKKAANKTQPSARGIKISSGGTLRASAQGPSTSNAFYTAPHERRPDDTAASSSAAVAAQPPPPPGQPPSPPPPPAVDEDTMSVPANVDEVAMLNNANDEGQKKRKNGATVSDPPDEEVTEDMVRKTKKRIYAFRDKMIIKKRLI